MMNIQEQEKHGEQLMRELKENTKILAILIGKIPNPIALFEAQRTASRVGFMMMDLAATEPEMFFVIFPIIEHHLKEAMAAIDLMRLRLRQPLVREKMLHQRN